MAPARRLSTEVLLSLSVQIFGIAYALSGGVDSGDQFSAAARNASGNTTAPTQPPTAEGSTGRLMVGVILSVVGDLMCAASLCVQKVAHNRIVADGDKISYTQSPLWWLGLLMNISGEVGNFQAYSFAPASVVAPVGAVGVVGNGVFAWYFLHEPLGFREIFGTGVVCAGVVAVVLGAPEGGHSGGGLMTADEIYALIVQPFQMVYFALCVIAGIGLFVASKRIGDKTVHCYTLLGADIGAYTVIAAKAVSTMLGTFSDSAKTMTFWVGVIMLVFCAVVSTKFLNDGMHHFDNAIVIPVYYCYFTLASIVGASVMYREYEQMLHQLWKIPVFLLGVSLLLGGVWIVTLGGKASDEPAPSTPGIPEPQAPSMRRRTTVAAEALGKYLPEKIGEQLAADPPRETVSQRRSTFVPGGNILAFSTGHAQRATVDVHIPPPLMEDGTSSNSSYHQM